MSANLAQLEGLFHAASTLTPDKRGALPRRPLRRTDSTARDW
jgi:hypothetical protein